MYAIACIQYYLSTFINTFLHTLNTFFHTLHACNTFSGIACQLLNLLVTNAGVLKLTYQRVQPGVQVVESGTCFVISLYRLILQGLYSCTGGY